MKNLTNEEFISLFRDDEKIENFIQNIDSKQLKEMLLSIHSRALGISYADDSFEKGDMILDGDLQLGVKPLKSPKNDIQQRVLEMTAESLKNIQGKKGKAVLLHYIENFLHLFCDGNGRTGRAILELFLNENFKFDSEICQHNEEDKCKVSTSNISEKYGIMNIESSHVASYANHYIYIALLKNGIIGEDYHDIISITAHSDDKNNPAYIPDRIKDELSPKQLEEITYGLTDGTGTNMTIAGLCCLIIEQGKQAITNNPVLGFSINSQETFANWSVEDYLKFIDVYREIKTMSMEILIDIFEHPEKFKIDDDLTLKEAYVENLYPAGKPFLENIKYINENGFIDIKDTRIEGSILKIKEILERNNEKGKTIKSTQELGCESLNEMLDINYTDKTEGKMNWDMKEIQSIKTEEK